jgi:flagellar hook assembly protein FlgD
MSFSAPVRLEIFNILGRRVRTLINEELPSGEYRAIWDGADDSGKPVSTGIYLYRFKAGDFVQTRKMVLLK